jgi:hypothetical protein
MNRRNKPTIVDVNHNFSRHPVFLVKREVVTHEHLASYREENEAGDTVFVLHAAPMTVPAAEQPKNGFVAIERTVYEFPTAFEGDDVPPLSRPVARLAAHRAPLDLVRAQRDGI